MKSFQYLLPLTGLLLMQPACHPNDFGDTNFNPGAIEKPVTSGLLTSAIGNTAGTVGFNYFPGLYCQYFSQSQFTNASRYAVVYYNWDNIYAGLLYDLQQIIQANSDPAMTRDLTVYGSNHNQIAVARILMTYNFASITDAYGDIPYSQALKLQAYIPYDRQEDVYAGMFNELREAVAQFDDGAPAAGDILFNGNIAKWKKFANSLRLILAMRLSKVAPDLAKSEFNAALNDPAGVIESNNNNAALSYPGGSYRNPWFLTYNGQKFYGICLTLTTQLESLGDPRLPIYGQPNNMGKVIGVPYGVEEDSLLRFTIQHPDWSLILKASLRTATAPLQLLTASQVLLARAEAAQRGWTGENAATLYRDGIQASFEQWGVYASASFNTYMAGVHVALDTDALRKIQLQRYLAFYPNGLQGWCEWRRTGVPQLQPTPFPLNASGQIPRRNSYPVSEQNLNNAAWNAAVARMGGTDSSDNRVWWDQ